MQKQVTASAGSAAHATATPVLSWEIRLMASQFRRILSPVGCLASRSGMALKFRGTKAAPGSLSLLRRAQVCPITFVDLITKAGKNHFFKLAVLFNLCLSL